MQKKMGNSLEKFPSVIARNKNSHLTTVFLSFIISNLHITQEIISEVNNHLF